MSFVDDAVKQRVKWPFSINNLLKVQKRVLTLKFKTQQKVRKRILIQKLGKVYKLNLLKFGIRIEKMSTTLKFIINWAKISQIGLVQKLLVIS